MGRTIYHGSEMIVGEPIYGYGRTDNDYGKGFYCTEDVELAREWASNTEKGGFLNKYEILEDGLRIINLRSPEYNILNWLAILLSNRRIRYSSPIEKRGAEYIIEQYFPDLKKADILVGYRADDSYFSFSRAFISNTITLEQLAHAMKYGDLGEQVVLVSKKAFERIEFNGAEVVDGKVYSPLRTKRDATTREAYQLMLEEEQKTGIYLSEIMKEGIKDEQLRIL
ncbi:DUF3990 domain-containing protein [Butyrivibrio sp. VCD2006]|uniref:DUF3990 domain-containing protein n=1 Tax=Butyrivibrio sp. VCD2006 TaxID=1280664 RepID=UPI0004096393|nr:DUF3990 domain-containing protein [Butyrivibrio sp. VCD2006]